MILEGYLRDFNEFLVILEGFSRTFIAELSSVAGIAETLESAVRLAYAASVSAGRAGNKSHARSEMIIRSGRHRAAVQN